MKYALNLADDSRILSVTYEKYAPTNAVIVESLPDGDVSEYRYVDGEYVYDPIPREPTEPKVSNEERIAELEEALDMLLSGVTE